MLSHTPLAVGLSICRDVQVHQPSGDVSLVRSFTGLYADSFPAHAQPFCVHAVLTDGYGEGELELAVTKFDDPMDVARRIRLPIVFEDRLQLVECVIRVNRCVFPSPGLYEFTLLADGEWMAHKAIRVHHRGDQA